MTVNIDKLDKDVVSSLSTQTPTVSQYSNVKVSVKKSGNTGLAFVFDNLTSEQLAAIQAELGSSGLKLKFPDSGSGENGESQDKFLTINSADQEGVIMKGIIGVWNSPVVGRCTWDVEHCK